MKYNWDPKKNENLKRGRGVSFEQIIFHLSQGDLWKVADHWDQDKYRKQRIYFVVMDNYVYLVPHRKESDEIFLITIIPSRKATRAYAKELEAQDEIG